MSPTFNNNVDEPPRVRPIERSHIGDLIRIADTARLSPWSARSYLDELMNQDSVMLRLIASDNTTIGFIVGRFVAGGSIDLCTDAEIYNIAVVESMQRRGYGQLLFDAFLSKCVERAVLSIWLEVRESNLNAIRFYERNRFERVQTRNHFYSDPREHAILMKRVLKNAEA